MEDLATPASTPSATAPGVGPAWPFVRRFFATFASPRSLFEELAERPSWLMPALLFALLSFALVAILWDPVILPEQLERMEAAGRNTEQVAAMLSGPFKYVQFAIGTVAAFGMLFLIALGAFVVGNFLLGGSLTYRQALSVIAHSSLVAVPSSIVRIPLSLASKTMQVSFGPGAFFPPASAEGFGAKFFAFFLQNLDLFVLWQVGLVALGVSVAGRLPLGKAAWGIGLLFLVFALVASCIGALVPR